MHARLSCYLLPGSPPQAYVLEYRLILALEIGNLHGMPLEVVKRDRATQLPKLKLVAKRTRKWTLKVYSWKQVDTITARKLLQKIQQLHKGSILVLESPQPIAQIIREIRIAGAQPKTIYHTTWKTIEKINPKNKQKTTNTKARKILPLWRKWITIE